MIWRCRSGYICVQGNHQNPNNQFMVKFFEKCEQLQGDEKLL